MTMQDILGELASGAAPAAQRVALNAKVDPHVRELLAETAQRQGVSVADLIAELVLERAGEALPRRDVIAELDPLPEGPFGTLLADPPWRFINRTGKVAPEHRRLSRYETMTTTEIAGLPIGRVAATKSHLYLWVPNALLADGLFVMRSWGFTYKGNIVWHKVRKDGGSDGRGVGFYFRNVTELVLFGVRGSMRTLPPARSRVNLLATRKREHSRKPDELYPIIEACSPGPRLELFARYPRPGWAAWGNESADDVQPQGRQYRGYGAGDAAPAAVQVA
jgi:N6-adenosine-specific RNA methylase IME4